MTNPAQWIDEATAPLRQKIGEGVDAFFNSIVGAFDRLMTKAVNEGGIVAAAQAVGNGLSNMKAAVKDNLPDVSSHGLAKPEIAQTQKLGRSAQPTQSITPEVRQETMHGLDEHRLAQVHKIREGLRKHMGEAVHAVSEAAHAAAHVVTGPSARECYDIKARIMAESDEPVAVSTPHIAVATGGRGGHGGH